MPHVARPSRRTALLTAVLALGATLALAAVPASASAAPKSSTVSGGSLN